MAKTKRTFRKINKRNKKNNKSKKRVSKRIIRKIKGGTISQGHDYNSNGLTAPRVSANDLTKQLIADNKATSDSLKNKIDIFRTRYGKYSNLMKYLDYLIKNNNDAPQIIFNVIPYYGRPLIRFDEGIFLDELKLNNETYWPDEITSVYGLQAAKNVLTEKVINEAAKEWKEILEKENAIQLRVEEGREDLDSIRRKEDEVAEREKPSVADNKAVILSLFETADKDATGFLDIVVLLDIINKNKAIIPLVKDYTGDELNKFIEKFLSENDTDGDGSLNYEELIKELFP